MDGKHGQDIPSGGSTAIDAAIRARTEIPFGVFFMAVAAGYLVICTATHASTAR